MSDNQSVSSTRVDDVECHSSEMSTDGTRRSQVQNSASSAPSVNEYSPSIISRLRSREPGQVGQFTHRYAHLVTGPEMIVDFDGPCDPYHPRNWSFRKKVITTVLYGFTAMGQYISLAYSLSFQSLCHMERRIE